MRIYQEKDYNAVSRRAASIIAAQVVSKPDCVLGLATGSTPVGAYQQLVKWYEQGDLSFAQVRSVNLDEYCGLAADPAEECRRYEAAVAALGYADLQLLGLGRNGHIGFNEPCDEFPLATHLVDLTPSTIEANARFFASAGDVPKQALTMGIGTIMKARKILVVANGADKADAVAKAFAGPVTPSMPASILQLHPDVTLVGDGSALAKLMEVKG